MSRDVLIVTNEPEICDAYFSRLYRTNLDIKKIENIPGGLTSGYVAQWKELDENGKTYLMGAPDETFNGIRFFRIPFAGFIYALKRARDEQRVDDRVLIVSVKEQVPTQLFSKKLFNLFINSAQKIRLDIFADSLDVMDSNHLLSSWYDDILEEAAQGLVPMVADSIYTPSGLTDN